MKLTCDFCKEEDNDLVWDDTHVMFSNHVMNLFLCKLCAKVNDMFWKFESIKMGFRMEIATNRRTFNRLRKEINNV